MNVLIGMEMVVSSFFILLFYMCVCLSDLNEGENGDCEEGI